MPILTASEVKAICFVTENVAQDKVEKAIVLVEDTHIVDAIGESLYNDYIANPSAYPDIQTNLKKSVAWYVAYELNDHIYSQVYNQGILTGSSDFAQPTNTNILKDKASKNRATGSAYLEKVLETIKKNPDNYPLFDSCESDLDSSYQRNGGIVMNLKRVNKDRDILNTTKNNDA